MNTHRCLFITALAAVLGSAQGQTFERRATMRGGEGPGQGKCTIEVVVDGTAEVEIRADRALLKNTGGRAPQWRRFECSGPLPANPADFRFRGIDGRGRQDLIRDPRNGGAAVVRIEDRDNGSEGYTFDIMWSEARPGGQIPDRGVDRGRDDDRGRGDDRGREDGYYRDRDQWFQREDWKQRFFEHVRQDVEHIRSITFPFGADQYRLSRTVQQLDELQSKLGRHYYDERELNDVIDALARVVRDNRLPPRDRDVLSDDLNRMREFRTRHNDWGAR
jgi:hypothetical protein